MPKRNGNFYGGDDATQLPETPRRRGNPFYGDSGTMFNENARDEIEKNAGNDFSGGVISPLSRDTTPEEDARLRQESPEDEYTKKARPDGR